jgi:hypothetical protein
MGYREDISVLPVNEIASWIAALIFKEAGGFSREE